MHIMTRVCLIARYKLLCGDPHGECFCVGCELGDVRSENSQGKTQLPVGPGDLYFYLRISKSTDSSGLPVEMSKYATVTPAGITSD